MVPSIMVNIEDILNRDMGCNVGLMVRSILGTGQIINFKDLESSIIPMAIFIMDSGLIMSKTDKVCLRN